MPQPQPQVGRIAVKCLGGSMHGKSVSAGIGTRFFRKVRQDGTVDSYRYTRSAVDGSRYFLLEPKP